MKTFELFPTPVGIYNLEREITKKEKNCIDLLLETVRPNAGNRSSEDTYVLKQGSLNLLQQFCLESINQFASEVLEYTDIKLRITQSWLNKSVKGDFHHLHRHPNSILSGVLYIETGEEDRISFTKNPDHSSFFFEVNNWNMYNAESWWLPVKAAELLIFPSHLFHGVPPVESESRISLSFNTFSVGSFGSVKSTSSLDL